MTANGFYRRVRQFPSSQRIAIGSAFVQVVVNVSQVTDAIFIVATGLSHPAPFANFSALTMYLEVSLALFLNVPIGGLLGPFTESAADAGAGSTVAVAAVAGIETEPAATEPEAPRCDVKQSDEEASTLMSAARSTSVIFVS